MQRPAPWRRQQCQSDFTPRCLLTVNSVLLVLLAACMSLTQHPYGTGIPHLMPLWHRKSVPNTPKEVAHPTPLWYRNVCASVLSLTPLCFCGGS